MGAQCMGVATHCRRSWRCPRPRGCPGRGVCRPSRSGGGRSRRRSSTRSASPVPARQRWRPCTPPARPATARHSSGHGRGGRRRSPAGGSAGAPPSCRGRWRARDDAVRGIHGAALPGVRLVALSDVRRARRPRAGARGRWTDRDKGVDQHPKQEAAGTSAGPDGAVQDAMIGLKRGQVTLPDSMEG
jgi:hypothetical protein